MRPRPEDRGRGRAAAACADAAASLAAALHGTLPLRALDVRAALLVDALGAPSKGDAPSVPGDRAALLADLCLHVADDADAHLRAMRRHDPDDRELAAAGRDATRLRTAARALGPCGADDRPRRAHGPSHGDPLGPIRVLADDCVHMLGAGPRAAAIGVADARRMCDAVTLASLVAMDGHPLDVGAVGDVNGDLARSADRLDALARGWRRLDPHGTTPEGRLGAALEAGVELVRGPVPDAFTERRTALEQVPDADEPLGMTFG